MSNKNRFTLAVSVAYLSSTPFSALADDGLSGLAGIIFAGFFLLALILALAFWTLVDSFVGTKAKSSDDKFLVKLLKLSLPITITLVVNALMVQGTTDLSGVLNTLNGMIALGLIILYVLSPSHNKIKYVTTGSWVIVLLLIAYVFWEWDVFSWF